MLRGALLDDESFLCICRETGRTRDLEARLLSLGRIEEATDAARQLTSDYGLLGLADEHDLLAHIHLDEGEIDLALEALAVLKGRSRYSSYHTDLAVAQHLVRVRDLLVKAGHADRWAALIAQIRDDK